MAMRRELFAYDDLAGSNAKEGSGMPMDQTNRGSYRRKAKQSEHGELADAKSREYTRIPNRTQGTIRLEVTGFPPRLRYKMDCRRTWRSYE